MPGIMCMNDMAYVTMVRNSVMNINKNERLMGH